MNLLIVDDSEPVRAGLRGLLSRIPGVTRIEDAATLAEALQSVQREAPHLLILDLHLPDGLGTQVIGALKQLAPGMQVAVLTLHAADGFRRKCLSLGADWFFDKGTEVDTLVDMVRQQAKLNGPIQHTHRDPA